MLALIVITNSYNKARSNCPVPSQATGENTLSPLNKMPLTAGFSLAYLKIRSRNDEAINSTRNKTDLLAKARRRQQIKKNGGTRCVAHSKRAGPTKTTVQATVRVWTYFLLKEEGKEGIKVSSIFVKDMTGKAGIL